MQHVHELVAAAEDRVGVVERDGETRAADLATETPEAYHLYARKGEAQFGEDAFAYLTATRTLGEADELADRLALIDANSQTDEYEKATRLARVQEDRVRRDPNSTDEDISAAKEARKALEAKAFVAAEEAKNSQRVDDERGDSVEHQAPQEQRVAAADQQPAQASQATERQYISVPFKEKDEAKQLGARWDRKEQSWYVPAGVDAAPFAKWSQGAATPAVEAKPTQQAPEAQDGGQKAAQAVQQARQYLAVPYEQRNAAKAAGALWDKAAKSWYAGPRADMAKLEQWKPENVQAQQGPAMTPREEFAEAMRSAGLFTGSNAQGDHPIMDGKRHRVPVEGGKKGALDGFYVGHLDGHPAGRIINNKTGTDITWKSKGYALSDQEKAKLQAEAAEKLAQRAVEQDKAQEATAQRVGRQMADLVPIEQPTPYLQAKGIQAQAGVMTDREGQKTYIPAFDAEGKQWTMQYIQEDGTKRFAKDSKKEGCFHPVGGMDALAAAPALVISEGYATAAQVAEAVGALGDPVDVEHRVHGLQHLVPLAPELAALRDRHEDGAVDIKAVGHLRVTLHDGREPADAQEERRVALEIVVEHPLSVLIGPDRAPVMADVDGGQRGRRGHRADGAEHRLRRRPEDGIALQLEPGRVEHHGGEGAGPLAGVQAADQSPRRMPHEHDPVVTLGAELRDGEVEFDEVVGQVRDVAGELLRAQGPAVAAQVEGVEVVAEALDLVGQVRLEEVVVPAVDVEQRGAGPGAVAAHERRHQRVLGLERIGRLPGQREDQLLVTVELRVRRPLAHGKGLRRGALVVLVLVVRVLLSEVGVSVGDVLDHLDVLPVGVTAAELTLQRCEIGVHRAILQIAGHPRLLRLCTAAPHIGSTPLPCVPRGLAAECLTNSWGTGYPIPGKPPKP